MASNTLNIQTLGHDIGAEILGLDLREPVSDELITEIENTLYQHAVIVIREQTLDTVQLSAFGQRFGPLQPSGRRKVQNKDADNRVQPETPNINFISNVKKNGKNMGSSDAGVYWHSDLCYEEIPSKATMLHALEIPEKDGVVYGSTRFTNVAAAFDALPEDMKNRLNGLKAVNSFRYMWNKKAHEFGRRPTLSQEELNKLTPDVIHPVVRTHPATKRKCLYVCEGYTSQIADISEQDSATLLEELFAHIIKPEFRYKHEWRIGDLLIWDNCTVQHIATFDYEAPLRRLMQRCTVQGSKTF